MKPNSWKHTEPGVLVLITRIMGGGDGGNNHVIGFPLDKLRVFHLDIRPAWRLTALNRTIPEWNGSSAQKILRFLRPPLLQRKADCFGTIAYT
jgi:hypothetical protein